MPAWGLARATHCLSLCAEGNSRACLSDADPIPGLRGSKGGSFCVGTAGDTEQTGPRAESWPQLGATVLATGSRAPDANRRAGHSGLHGQPVDLVPRKPLLGLHPRSFSFLQSGQSANLPDPLVWVLGPDRDGFCLIHRVGQESFVFGGAQTAESLWDG